MATWGGWQNQLLAAAGLPASGGNLNFLTSWADNANRPGCARNPVDISHGGTGAANCASLPSGKTAQRFSTHANAAKAFAAQLTAANYSHLRSALVSGAPFDVSDPAGVSLDLQKWGSTKWQAVYDQSTGQQSGGGGSGGGGSQGIAPNTLRGLHAVKHSFSRFGNQTLQARANTQAALSMLPRRRRVRR